MHTGLQPRALGQRDGRMEQPFEDAGKAMTSQVPRAGVWCDGGHYDDDDDDDVSLFSDPKVAASLPEQQLD